MFQRILVPLDGSLRAERALPLAAQIARASQGMLVLLRVISAAEELGPNISSRPPFVRTLVQTQMEEAHQYLTVLASSQAFTGISLTATVLPGPVIPTIREAIQSYQADLVVLCARSDPQGRPEPISNLAGQVIEGIDTPLLLIPEHGPLTPTARTDRQHQAAVLVAFDGPQPAYTLVEPASSLLAALNGQGEGHLHFVPLHSSENSSAGAPVCGEQMIGCPGSPGGGETRQTGTPVLSRDDGTEKGVRSDEGDVLVLEMPAGSERAKWISEENQRLSPSEKHIPLLLVPSAGRR
jgi:nucleotide-binding universal stress UspA family protein